MLVSLRSAGLALLSLTACGGGAGAEPVKSSPASAPAAVAVPAQPAQPAQPQTRPVAAAAPAIVFVYVRIEHGWVEKYVPANAAEAKAWGADPANLKSLLPQTRHVLVKVGEDAPAAEAAAARKKAEAVLARLKRGEDFAKVARETSDDPGSKDKGGAYPGDMVANFVEPYRTAYAALAPGEITKQLVKSQFGWHVIKKDRVDEPAITKGYLRVKTLELARKLAMEIASRAKSGTPMDRATQESIVAVLGATAAKDPDHAATVVFGPGDPSQQTSASCQQVTQTARGDISVGPLPDDFGWVVATARDEMAAERDARAANGREEKAPAERCDSMGALTPEKIRAIMESIKKEKDERGH